MQRRARRVGWVGVFALTLTLFAVFIGGMYSNDMGPWVPLTCCFSHCAGNPRMVSLIWLSSQLDVHYLYCDWLTSMAQVDFCASLWRYCGGAFLWTQGICSRVGSYVCTNLMFVQTMREESDLLCRECILLLVLREQYPKTWLRFLWYDVWCTQQLRVSLLPFLCSLFQRSLCWFWRFLAVRVIANLKPSRLHLIGACPLLLRKYRRFARPRFIVSNNKRDNVFMLTYRSFIRQLCMCCIGFWRYSWCCSHSPTLRKLPRKMEIPSCSG